MKISLICACKNRNEALQIALSSWLLRPEIVEIIIVDWSSDESLAPLTKLDKRIKIITVLNQKYFNQPQPLNLAASIATGDYILKVDCDYIFSPYYNFFDTYQIDENTFVSGKHNIKNYEVFNGEQYVVDKDNMSLLELVEYVNSYSPIFKHLIGLLFVSRKNFMKIGGYNENLGKYYAYEDDEIFHRFRVLGLQEKKLNFDYNVLHIPHSDKKRTENFEGYNSQQLNNIKESLIVEGDDVKEWNAQYLLAMEHIENNKKIAPLTSNYYVNPITKWNIQQIDKQNYYANRIMNNKLENFPSVYYVSLEECKDRQENIEKQFAEYGITPTSILSKRFSESDDEITGKFLNQMNGGTIGCVVSHLKAIRKWYEETNEDYAFFCEDDLSLETVNYWDFTWEEFIGTIPEDVCCVQLLVIRKDYDTFDLRKRYWDDWAGTAYIITRNYAKVLVENYCLGEKRFHLELPGSGNVLTPLLENVLFETLEDVCYTVPLFVEDIRFNTTFSPKEDKDVNGSQKNGHIDAYKIVLNYWKNKMKSFKVFKNEDSNMNQIEVLLTNYSSDPDNAQYNFNLGMWYWNEGHTAPALSYFLRSAELSEEDLLAYEALLWAHQCYEKQGTRDSTARTLLQHAINLLPTRPEAYFLLAKFHGKREQWTDAYSVSHQGLTFLEKNLEPLKNSVGYLGEFSLLYEKAVAGWWWGKGNETRKLLQDIKNNYELPEQYEKSVQDLLMTYGVGQISEDIIKYNKTKHDRLRFKFPGSGLIEKNYSQAYQDMFVLAILNGKRNGTYLEIGAQEPFYQNNSALLETEFDWKGTSIEIREDLCKMFAEQRKNQILCKDATKINYERLLDEMNVGTDLDYLQVDCEPSKTTFEILTAIPFEKYRFAVITYEHDHSVDITSSYRDKSRRFLKSYGYELVVKDVAFNDEYTFEDWWVHPDLVNPDLVSQMKSVDTDVTNIVKYFFT